MTTEKSNATILPPRSNLAMGIVFTVMTVTGLYTHFVEGRVMDNLDRLSVFCTFPFLAIISFRSLARQRSADKAQG
jgi:hypothetical protein